MKRLFRFALVLMLVLVASSFALTTALKAQSEVSEQDAIDNALYNPILASGSAQLSNRTSTCGSRPSTV